MPSFDSIVEAPGLADFQVFKFYPPKPPTYPHIKLREISPSKSHLVHTIEKMGSKFSIKFEVMVTSFDNGEDWGSILRFTTTDNNKNNIGDRIFAMFTRKTGSFRYNMEPNRVLEPTIDQDASTNRWYKVEVMQYSSGNNEWTFQLDVDGTSLFKKNYNSDKPIYRNVDVYIGDKFHEPALVKIKNFEYTEVDESPVEDLPQIMMTIASNQEFAFMTDYCSLTTWIYEPTESKFIPAIVPNRNDIQSELVGLEVERLADKTVFVIAEKSRLQVFRFVPFQGLYLIDSVDATNIKDFAVFKKDHIRDSLNIFVVEENNQSKMYRLMTKDYVPKFNMTYGRLNYN